MTTKRFIEAIERLNIKCRRDVNEGKERFIIHDGGVTLAVVYPDLYSVSWMLNLGSIWLHWSGEELLEALCEYDSRKPEYR